MLTITKQIKKDNNHNFKNKLKIENTYIPLTGELLEHILLSKNLSNLEKLYYILANSLSLVNYHCKKQRSIALPAKLWADMLNCSKSQVLTMQKILEQKGYFLMKKEKNQYKQNKRNLIFPTLPDNIFQQLLKSPGNITKKSLFDYNQYKGSKLEFLDETKLFIRVNYKVLKNIISCKNIKPFHKMIWLELYMTQYKSLMKNLQNCLDLPLIISYQHLQKKYSCSKSLISKTLTDLTKLNFIKRERFYIIKNLDLQGRKDFSLWKINLIIDENLKEGFDYKNISNYKTIETQESKPILRRLITNLKIKNPFKINSVDQILRIDKEFYFNKSLDYTISYSDPKITINSPYNKKNLKINIKLISNDNINTFIKKSKENQKTFNEESTKDPVNQQKLNAQAQNFSVYKALLENATQLLSPEKVSKARKFAYSLFSKKSRQDYILNLSKKELADQFILHAAFWKPTKIDCKGNKEKQVNIALSVAWSAVINSRWKEPIKLTQARILDNKLLKYKEEYRNHRTINDNIQLLEKSIKSLLRIDYDLSYIIEREFSKKKYNAPLYDLCSKVIYKKWVNIESSKNSREIPKERYLNEKTKNFSLIQEKRNNKFLIISEILEGFMKKVTVNTN